MLAVAVNTVASREQQLPAVTATTVTRREAAPAPSAGAGFGLTLATAVPCVLTW